MKASLPALTFCLISGLTAIPALGGPALSQLSVERDGDSYQASCRLEGALTPEVDEEIASGLTTTIEYHLNVYRRRTAFFDQAVVKHRVECTVRYDTLTQQYTLTRRVDDDLQETRVTDDPTVMREFMTSLKAVPLLKVDLLKQGEDYYLKAKSSLGLVWRFYVIPWSMDTEWKRVPIGPSGGGKDVATRP
jgi:uncharacterized protein DUF4390